MLNCLRVLLRRYTSGFAALLVLLGASAQPVATQTAPSPESKSGANIGAAWDTLLQGTIPQSAPDQALTVEHVSYEGKRARDFPEHFFMNARIDYLRTQTFFTGLPTLTGVIDAPPGQSFNPEGIPYPPAFQSDTNTMYSFLNIGTHGWLSDRVNSNFTLAYSGNVTHVTNASPQLSILDTFGSNSLFQLVSGYVDINGQPTDGIFAGTSLRIGRQAVWGAEVAAFDGASFTMDRPRFSWTIYGGRRFTYYSDPTQRAIGGGNFLFRFTPNISLEYDILYYINGANLFRYRQAIGNSWMFGAGFRMVGTSPTDLWADATWSPRDGKTLLRLAFAELITDEDYIYDYTYAAHDTDPYITLTRLNLGRLQPHTQFVVDASRAINSKLRLGGTVWVRQLNNRLDASQFDTSFQDYRVQAQVFPWNRSEGLVGYHLRNSQDRTGSVPPTGLDDLGSTGETKVQDISVEIGRSFMEGRLNLRAGGFYRLLNFRDIFVAITNAHDTGVLADASFNLDSRTRLYMNYGLDTDFSVWRPSIQNSQTFRFGMVWRY